MTVKVPLRADLDRVSPQILGRSERQFVIPECRLGQVEAVLVDLPKRLAVESDVHGRGARIDTRLRRQSC